MLSPALQLKNIVKYYQQVRALDNVSIDIAPGSIHGIIGENGAGKSTLLKIAYGLLAIDDGEIFVDGVKVNIDTPQQAVKHGIGMLHQSTSWLEKRSIIDNIILGDSNQSWVGRNDVSARFELEQLCREFGFSFSLDTLISALDYSQRQLVDILRSLYRGAKVLILDEPTALLSSSQSSHLIELLSLLKMQGVSIVIVAHKLAILHQLCDVISVMSQGMVIAQVNPRNITMGALSKLMIGREITLPHSRVKKSIDHRVERLKVTNLSIKTRGRFGFGRDALRLFDIDLTVQSHEITALVGLPNSGHELLLEVLSGHRGFTAGRITMNKKRFKPSNHYGVKQAHKMAIASAPDPLLGIGLVKELPMYESALLGYHQHLSSDISFFKDSLYIRRCRDMMKLWDVRPVLPELRSGYFSGGNQQKMILARELSHNPDLLLLSQPSHGVDVGATESIYKRLFKLREQGGSIMFCSTDLDEVMSLSDRVVLFEQGQIIGQYKTQDLTKNELSLMLINEAACE